MQYPVALGFLAVACIILLHTEAEDLKFKNPCNIESKKVVYRLHTKIQKVTGMKRCNCNCRLHDAL